MLVLMALVLDDDPVLTTVLDHELIWAQADPYCAMKLQKHHWSPYTLTVSHFSPISRGFIIFDSDPMPQLGAPMDAEKEEGDGDGSIPCHFNDDALYIDLQNCRGLHTSPETEIDSPPWHPMEEKPTFAVLVKRATCLH